MSEPENEPGLEGVVLTVSRSPAHGFSKTPVPSIRLLAGIGVEGDAHAGREVKHRSRVRRDPQAPNLRQVHLLHAELLEALRGAGFAVAPGALGENVLVQGLALLELPRGTRLASGERELLELTGLRNPCAQLDAFAPGLMAAVLERRADGGLVRKAGVMAIVLQDADLRPGDRLRAVLPAGPHQSLEPV